MPKVNNKKLGYQKGVPFEKRKTVYFNYMSRRQIEFCLRRKYGWEPKLLTGDGHAQIDDVVLAGLPYPEAKRLSEIFLIQKRIGQLAEGSQAWLKKVEKDGKLRHRIISGGCISGRASHVGPNLAQVPSTRQPYGEQCRELFTVQPGYSLAGSDLSGLELRCLAHFLQDGGALRKRSLAEIYTPQISTQRDSTREIRPKPLSTPSSSEVETASSEKWWDLVLRLAGSYEQLL